MMKKELVVIASSLRKLKVKPLKIPYMGIKKDLKLEVKASPELLHKYVRFAAPGSKLSLETRIKR